MSDDDFPSADDLADEPSPHDDPCVDTSYAGEPHRPDEYRGAKGLVNRGDTVGVLDIDAHDVSEPYPITRIKPELLGEAVEMAKTFGMTTAYLQVVNTDAVHDDADVAWPMLVLSHEPDARLGLVVAPRLRDPDDPLPLSTQVDHADIYADAAVDDEADDGGDA